MTTGGGSKSESFRITLIFSIFSHAASSLHHDTFASTASGSLISNQQGPLTFLSSRKVSNDDIMVPKMCENVRYFLFVGGGGKVACKEGQLIIQTTYIYDGPLLRYTLRIINNGL